MNRIEKSVALFAEGFNCSQSVFASFVKEMDKETALKMASGFGGGMGRMAETCGAVTGAMMVLGLHYGATLPNPDAKERIYEKIRTFSDRFKARNGSIQCRALLHCDISTPEGYQAAKEKNAFTNLCPKFVQDAAEILEEMLNDIQEKSIPCESS